MEDTCKPTAGRSDMSPTTTVAPAWVPKRPGHRPLPGAVRTAPGRPRRSTPLIRMLARLGRQRDPRMWAVPCWDLDGHRARLLIRLAASGITITTAGAGPLRLDPLQVGQLRAAARDAILTFGLLADPEHPESSSRGR